MAVGQPVRKSNSYGSSGWSFKGGVGRGSFHYVRLAGVNHACCFSSEHGTCHRVRGDAMQPVAGEMTACMGFFDGSARRSVWMRPNKARKGQKRTRKASNRL